MPASALRSFAIGVGVTKFISLTDMAVFDHAIREDLNKRAPRKLAVLRPLKLTITNLSPHHYEELDAVNNPEDPGTGTRKIPFVQSSASLPVMFLTATVMVIGILIPFSPLGTSIGFQPLPIGYFPWLVATLLSYCVLTQIVKTIYIRRFGKWL